ncbi:hypothetical protein [Arthrobacter sp. UYCo732]|uniref:hypothetical protein n=1 Tax=Arthrobacter sp. UYCo732 TaxID=3156336 RepID=UPI003399D225
MSQKAWRYEVLDDDDRWGLRAGDILIGFPYVHDPGSRSNPDGKVSILWREGDNHRPECSQYWYNLRQLRGRVLIEWDPATKEWRAGSARRPLSRAKRHRHASAVRTTTR